jgi:hypothetical protein
MPHCRAREPASIKTWGRAWGKAWALEWAWARRCATGACLALVGSAVLGQTIYRCGAAGNVYSHQPCADGRALVLDDTRSTAQVAEARKLERDNLKLADRLARERQAFEAAHPARAAAGIQAPPVSPTVANPVGQPHRPKDLKRATRQPGRWRPDEGQDFMAKAPAAPKKANKTTAP